MAGDAKSDGPVVTETPYVATSDGPNEDTGIFYKGTPGPNVRELGPEMAPADTGRHSRKGKKPEWLPRSKSTPPKHKSPIVEPKRVLWVLTVGVLLLIAIALVTMLGISMIAKSGPETAPKEEPGEFEGVRVKKGLR